MKFNDAVPGIHHHREVASPEAKLAQIVAERDQLSKYRAQRIQFYKDWSNPEAIAKRTKEHLEQAAAALEQGKKISLAMRDRDNRKELGNSFEKLPGVTVTPIFKPRPGRWQRFKAWISTIFSKK